MKTDVIIAGVGGQGILSLGAIIGQAALYDGVFVKQAETHGMSQRGGAVVTHVRLSEQPVFADLIHHGQADIILSVEPMEALRQLPFLKQNGYLITNTNPCRNLPDYPEMDQIEQVFKHLPKVIQIDATGLATNIGHSKVSNLVMLGALSPFLRLSEKAFEAGIDAVFANKGEEVVRLNSKAFQVGREIGTASV